MNRALPSSMPRPGTVLLFHVRLAAVTPGAVAGLRAWLSPDERSRHERFLDAGAALEFVTGRALLRSRLAALAGTDASAWAIGAGTHGRPFAVGPAGAPTVSFNLSHTRGRVVLAVGHRDELGVDVEALDRRVDVLAVAHRYFSADEVRALHALPATLHRERFLTLWTLKEAYLKARGVGLGLPLGAFGFSFRGGRARVRFEAPIVDDPAAWCFATLDLDASHRVAVAQRGRALHVVAMPVPLETLAGLPSPAGAV